MEIQITSDGSRTIYLPEIDEHYHSINGAEQESVHVYVQAGFNECRKQTITLLEMGFGTGLNAFLTAMEAAKREVFVQYVTLEKFPLEKHIIEQLHYGGKDNRIFEKIHRAEWGTTVTISPYFSILKIKTDFSDYTFPDNYDVVYYDAFAPDKQEEVWSRELFDKIYRQMNPGGILTTYCAKGTVRRMMMASGFQVERIPGPAGKREMLRARKINPPDEHSEKE